MRIKKILASLTIISVIVLSACGKTDNNEQDSTDESSSESLIFTGSKIGDEITENLPKTERDDYSLHMKFKTDGSTLKIYKINGYRTYNYISDYYIAILRAVQKSDLTDYNKVIIDSEFDHFVFNAETIKELPLSDSNIKKLGFSDEGDPNCDDYVDNYLKTKAISYKDKTNTDGEE